MRRPERMPSMTSARFLSAYWPFKFFKVSRSCLGESAGHPIIFFVKIDKSDLSCKRSPQKATFGRKGRLCVIMTLLIRRNSALRRAFQYHSVYPKPHLCSASSGVSQEKHQP